MCSKGKPSVPSGEVKSKCSTFDLIKLILTILSIDAMAKHLYILLLFSICLTLTSSKRPIDGSGKIAGVSWVGRPKEVTATELAPLKEVGANWICVIPFAFGEQNKPVLKYNMPWQWWGETEKGIVATIKLAKANGLKVMLKPQVWLHDGTYVGHFTLATTADRSAWEKAYTAYILDFAKIAEEQGVELFSIGTEWSQYVQDRPQFWAQLIADVRTVYKGKLTYADNWDSFELFPHWDKLDLIGIDAYFPLSDQRTPDVGALIKAWRPHYNKINTVHNKTQKPVIFTEYGYRSVDYNTKAPWVHSKGSPQNVNLQAQQNAFEALFRTFWQKDWFEGGFLWNWLPEHCEVGGDNCDDFTPQNKPASAIVRKWYQQ